MGRLEDSTKISPEEEAAFKSRLLDRSWLIIESPHPIGAMGRIFSMARKLQLSETVLPTFIIKDSTKTEALFCENPDLGRIRRFCILANCQIFVTNRGYTLTNAIAPDDKAQPLDWDQLVVGSIHNEAFEHPGFFVVASQLEQVRDEDTDGDALAVSKLICFRVPEVEKEE